MGVYDMSKVIPDWMVQVAWFAAGICATGAFWYFLSQKDYTWTVVTGFGALVFAGLAVYLHVDGSSHKHRHKEQIASFLKEAQQLRTRLDEVPVPIGDYNEWVDRVERYLRQNLGKAYEVRFSDFSGMIFYGEGSERSKMSRSIDGRSRRLNEFMSELSR
jgi:hypothetical protein